MSTDSFLNVYSSCSSQQSRNNYSENGSGDSPRENPAAPGTFFRNNERFSGSNSGNSGSRFEGRGGSSSNFKSRDGNYRAGSGRFAGSNATAAAAAPTPAAPTQGLRK